MSASISVPKNGALLLRKGAGLDLTFLRVLADGVQSAARHQEAAGDVVDDAEISVVRGPYDWRSYLFEELDFAVSRDDLEDHA